MKLKKEDKINNKKRIRTPFASLWIFALCLAVLLSVPKSFAQNLPRPLNVIRIVPHLLDPNIIYALDESHGVFKSVDSGNSWIQKNLGLDQLPEILPLSIHPEFFTELAMDRNTPDLLYVVKNWLIFRSHDGAETWSFSGNGTESFEYGTNSPTYFINEVVTHPIKSAEVYAGTIVDGATGGVFRSEDGGITWGQIAGDIIQGSGLGNDASPIIIDPVDPLRIYAGGVHSIFFRSIDGGFHWEQSNPVPMEGSAWPMDSAINPFKTSEIFLGATIFSPQRANKTFLSKDFGISWSELIQIKGGILSIQFAPSNSNIVYAISSTDARFQLPIKPVSTILYRSENNGVTWTELGSHTFGFQTLAVDPFNPKHIYAGTRHGGVIQSFDGGDSFITR